jgi:hypothetical protein
MPVFAHAAAARACAGGPGGAAAHGMSAPRVWLRVVADESHVAIFAHGVIV